ncbi:MAG: hypothetical protein AUJ12_02485 [Alphaproteobacteria bacterium CG1_02_46_17]|nr:MAG: hypothetical protein AUJ12_02485 [Alphaproteobacteria bacterium CG1_02_46_17]
MITEFKSSFGEEFWDACQDMDVTITTLTFFPIIGSVENRAELDCANRVASAMEKQSLGLSCKFLGATKAHPSVFPDMVFSTKDAKSSERLFGFLSACMAFVPHSGYNLRQATNAPGIGI